MFFSELLKILFWTFSVFGLFCALRWLGGYILIKNGSYIKSEIVLRVKNDEDTIENTIRILAEEIFFTAREKLLLGLTIVDTGSEDSTMEIVRLLKKEYPFLKIVGEEEYD